MKCAMKVTRDQIVKRGDVLVVDTERGTYAVLTEAAYQMLKSGAQPAEVKPAAQATPMPAPRPQRALTGPRSVTERTLSETRAFNGRDRRHERSEEQQEISRLAILDWAAAGHDFTTGGAVAAMEALKIDGLNRNHVFHDVNHLYETGYLSRRAIGGGKLRTIYQYQINGNGLRKAQEIGGGRPQQQPQLALVT